MNYGKPLDLVAYETKDEAMQKLTDVLATMVWMNIENHSTSLVRTELTGDIHMSFMIDEAIIALDENGEIIFPPIDFQRRIKS